MLKAAPGSISPADAEPIIAQDLVRVEGKACVDPSDRRCRAVMAVGLAVATGRIFSRMPIRNAIPELFNSDLASKSKAPLRRGFFCLWERTWARLAKHPVAAKCAPTKVEAPPIEQLSSG